MRISLVYRLLGAAVGLQLAVGGLVTFGYIDASAHIVLGVIVGILAIVALAYAFRATPRIRPLVGITVGIGVDVVVQAILGFASLGTQTSNGSLSTALAFVHFLNALGIFGMALSATFMAMRFEGMAAHAAGPPTG